MNLQTITMWIANLNVQAKDLGETCIKLSVWLQCNEWWELMILFKTFSNLSIEIL